jgi:hypothetical protein
MDRNEEKRVFIETQFPLWEQAFDRYLCENKYPRDALDKLLAAGCQRRTVAGLLFPYCFDLKPPKALVKSERWRAFRKKVNRLASELDEVSRDMEELCEGVDLLLSVALRLKTDAELMRLLCTASEGETNLRHSYGNSFYLVRLSLYIREATEGDYCDGDVAYLVEAAFAAARQDKHFDEDAMRKCRERFRQRNQTSFEKLELDAAEYFAQFGRQGDPESKPFFPEWATLR